MMGLSDRERERERQRQLRERQAAAQRNAVREEPVPFFPPINRVRPVENDETARRISAALGQYDDVRPSILKGDCGLLGVDNMPATPAPARMHDEEIDTALPRVVPTPEKLASTDFFATPQKRAPVRHPPLSGQKNGVQMPIMSNPSQMKPPFSTAKPFQPTYNPQQVWQAPGETPNHDLDEILRDMTAPSPIAPLAPTPARTDASVTTGNQYFQGYGSTFKHSNSLDQDLVVSDSEAEVELDPKKSLGLNLVQRPLSPFKSIRVPSPPRSRTSPDPRRAFVLNGIPRPISPFKSIRVPSPPRLRPESPDPKRLLGLSELPGRLSPFKSIRVPSPVRTLPASHVAPIVQVSPRGPSNMASEPMEISSEEEESGDSSSESEEESPSKSTAQTSPKNSTETSPSSHWNLGNFIKTTPLNHSINGDTSDNGPPSEPPVLELKDGPNSVASVTLSQAEEGHPLTPAGFPVVDNPELSQVEADLSDGEIIDITTVVKQFKVVKAVSPLGDSDPEEHVSKKPFANLMRAVGDRGVDKKPVIRPSMDSGSDLDSKAPMPLKPTMNPTLVPKNSDIPRNLDFPRSPKLATIDTQPKMDQNKSKSISQIFRPKGKQTPKQDPVASGKENIPREVPVIKCSLKLNLLRRIPHKTDTRSAVDKVIDDVARGEVPEARLDPIRTAPEVTESEIGYDNTKKRQREPSTSTVSSDSESDFPVHRKEEKRKRIDTEDSRQKKNSPAFPSQPMSHPSPSVHLAHETNHERTEKGIPSPYVDAEQPACREPGFPQSGATVESGYESLPGIGYDQEEYRDWQQQRVYYSYYEIMKMESELEPDERDQNDYLQDAKRLKHMADKESDKVVQFALYLQAAMFFIQTGDSMDSDGTPNKGTQNMYKETNNLINMKAQAILQLKLFKLKRAEVRDHTRMINEYFSRENHPIPAPDGFRSTNTSSPSPSPSGSVNSVGSHSNGARSGESKSDDHGQPPPMIVPVPPSMHVALARHHHNVGLLQACHDLWEQADQMVVKTRSEDFFIQMDQEFGPLSLHSSLRELVRKVRAAVERLNNYYRDCVSGREPTWP